MGKRRYYLDLCSDSIALFELLSVGQWRYSFLNFKYILTTNYNTTKFQSQHKLENKGIS
mgnify:CR=1 FL=1